MGHGRRDGRCLLGDTMRTFKKTFAMRLEAQADEAEFQGITKLASHLRNAVDATPKRDNDEFYVYSSESLANDVEGSMWNAILRTADFFDCNIDTATVQGVVEKYSKHLINEIRLHAGIKHGVGAYEPAVPGEMVKRAVIEVNEEDV